MKYEFEGYLTQKDNELLALRSMFKVRLGIWIACALLAILSLLTQMYLYTIVLVAYIFIIEFILRLRAKRAYQSNRLMEKEQKYSISSEEFTAQNDNSQTSLKPDEIYQVKIYPEVIYLFISRQQSMILMKSWMKDGSWEELNQMIKDNWPVKKSK